MSTLQHRQTRQQRALHRWEGCRVFFHNHPRQSRSVIGRAELRKAAVWVRVLRRELGETRRALIRKVNKRISVPQVICAVFGAECSKAVAVSSCETGGTFSTSAANGQYFGLFQMGSSERARFGGSSLDPWDQARAAYRYWQVAGWGPWSCA